MKSSTPTKHWLTPAQMASQTGVSIDTLRYYEREGLINVVERTTSGHRRYSADDVLWVEVLRCLRDTGMSIEQLRQYCDLGKQGDHTQPERMLLLQKHRDIVLQQLAAINESLVLIDHKIDFYKDALANDKNATEKS